MFRRSRSLRSQMSSSRAALNRPWLSTHPDDDELRPHPLEGRKTARGLLVVQTFAVDGPPGLGIHHYELHFATDAAAEPLVLLTRDLELANRAIALEGTETRVALAFHPSKRPDGTSCLVLDTLIRENR